MHHQDSIRGAFSNRIESGHTVHDGRPQDARREEPGEFLQYRREDPAGQIGISRDRIAFERELFDVGVAGAGEREVFA